MQHRGVEAITIERKNPVVPLMRFGMSGEDFVIRSIKQMEGSLLLEVERGF